MDHAAITVEHSSAEEHHHVDNQHCEILYKRNLIPKEIGSVVNKAKQSSMNPTPLYISFYSFTIIMIY